MSMSSPDTAGVREALQAWGMADAAASPITEGHINHTFLVCAPHSRYVLQRLSPIFGPEVNLDMDAVTAHLQRAGLTTPRLLRTTDGDLWHQGADGVVWRVMTFVPGHTVQRVDSADRCADAGALLGRFHRTLWDCDHQLEHQRARVHHTARHLAALQQSLVEHTSHRDFSRVAPVADRILRASRGLPLLESLPPRLVHGDPKITNIIFDDRTGAPVCLVDLDTLARMPLALELGDALRSWCSPLGEEREGDLDLDFFGAAMSGYASAVGALPEPAEREAIPAAVQLIAVELSARFCADALDESYFGWDEARFVSATEHNLARARSQIFLAESARKQMGQMERLVRELWE